MKLHQRIVIGAAAAASALGGASAVWATGQAPKAAPSTSDELAVTSVVYDSQASEKRRLWNTWANQHDRLDHLLARLAHAEAVLRATQHEQATAGSGSDNQVGAQVGSQTAQVSWNGPAATQTSQPPTTDTATGASASSGGSDESEGRDDDGRDAPEPGDD